MLVPKIVTISPGATAPLWKFAAFVIPAREKKTGGGIMVTVAAAFAMGLARLWAMMETFVGVSTTSGAEYEPACVRIPRGGESVQRTAVLGLLPMLAVNCCFAPAATVAVGGDTPTLG